MYAFEPVSRKEIANKRFKNDNISFLEEFIASSHEVIKLTKYTQLTAYQCANSLKRTIRQQKMVSSS
jgi:4-alpha-glucanotransferase